MIVHHRKTADSDREDLCKLLQALLDPCLTIVLPLAQQERTPDAPGHAVVPSGQSWIDEMSTCDRHRRSLRECAPKNTVHKR